MEVLQAEFLDLIEPRCVKNGYTRGITYMYDDGKVVKMERKN